MVKSRRRNLLILFGLAILALMLLTTALPEMRFASGDPFPFGLLTGNGFEQPTQVVPTSGESDLFRVLALIVIWVLLPIAVVYIFVSPEGRRRLLQSLPAIILLLLFLNWFRELAREPRTQQTEEAAFGSPDLPQQSMPAVPDFVADPPPWFLTGVNILLVLIFLAVVYFLRRLFGRREEDSQALIVKEAEKTLAEIQAGADLKNAILRCYVEMGEVLQREKHVKRRRGMTAREFETQLTRMGLDDAHIVRLTRLFEQVRYSPTAPGGREEREAVDCLNAIVRAYGGAS